MADELPLDVAPFVGNKAIEGAAMAFVMDLLPTCGRDAQSMAFFKNPGTPWLYSGVATSSASACQIACLKETTDAGSHVSGPTRRGRRRPER